MHELEWFLMKFSLPLVGLKARVQGHRYLVFDDLDGDLVVYVVTIERSDSSLDSIYVGNVYKEDLLRSVVE